MATLFAMGKLGVGTSKAECLNPLSSTGASEQSAISPDRKYGLSTEILDGTAEVNVKLKMVETGETIIIDTLKAINISDYGSLGPAGYSAFKNQIMFTNNGKIAAVSVKESLSTVLYDTSNWKNISSISSILFSLSPNGKFLAVADDGWKFGWALRLFAIDEKEGGLVVGNGKLLSGMEWCISEDKKVCPKDRINGHSWDGDAHWYKGQNFRFSEDSSHLGIEISGTYYLAYDLQKNSLEEKSCTRG